MKSWNQWSRQNSLVMVMDNKGPQETKMEQNTCKPSLCGWISPTHLKHMNQVKLDFPFPPKNGSCLWQTNSISVAPSYWATKWLTVSNTRFPLLETNIAPENMEGIPKRKVGSFPTINLQVAKMLVSGTDPPMLWLQLLVGCPNFWVSKRHVFGSNPKDPKLTRNTTCFIVKFARFIPKVWGIQQYEYTGSRTLKNKFKHKSNVSSLDNLWSKMPGLSQMTWPII